MIPVITYLASLFLAAAVQVPQQPTDLELRAAQFVESQPGEAVSLLQQAVGRLESANEPASLARALNSLAFALSKTGQHNEATSAGERALKIARGIKEPSEWTATIRRNLAEINDKADRLSIASAYVEAAVIDAEGTWGKTPLTAEYREYAAILAMRQGNPRLATEHLGWAIAICDKIFAKTQPERVAKPSAMLAHVLRQQGRRSTAWQLNDYAIGSLEKANQTGNQDWRNLMETRSGMLQELGEFPTARETLQRTIALASAAGGVDKGHYLAWAGQSLMLGETKQARLVLDKAPPIASDPAERWMLQAQVELAEGKWQDALTECQKAAAKLLAKAREEGSGAASRPVSVDLAWLRSRARIGLGLHEESLKDLFEVLNIERQLWGEDSSRLVRTFAGMIESELAASDTTPELIDFVDMLAQSEQWLSPRTLATLDDRSWWTSEPAFFDAAMRAWLRLAATRKKWAAKSFQAVDRLRQRTRAAATATAIERAEQSVLLGDVRRLLASEPAQQTGDRSQLRADFKQKLARLRIAEPRLANRLSPKGASLEAVQAELAHRGQSMLQISCTSNQVIAWWLPTSGKSRIVPLGTAKDLLGRVQQALALLASSKGECDLAPLSKALLSPLWEELATQSDVVIVADSALAFLPFEALPTPAGKPWIVATRISYAGSAAEWLAYKQPRDQTKTSCHLLRGQGQPSNPQLQLLQQRVSPQPPRTGLAVERSLSESEAKIRSEHELRAAQQAGSLRSLRLIEVLAPAFIDTVAPSATGIVLGTAPQQQQPLWERDDGYLDTVELGQLELDSDFAVLWSSQSVYPMTADHGQRLPRDSGLYELVVSLHDAGVRGVLLAGWTGSSYLDPGFENLVRKELLTDDPKLALCRAQRAWLERATNNKAMASPRVWARVRYWGR